MVTEEMIINALHIAMEDEGANDSQDINCEELGAIKKRFNQIIDITLIPEASDPPEE